MKTAQLGRGNTGQRKTIYEKHELVVVIWQEI